MTKLLEWLRPVWVVMRRELRDHMRDWRIILPIVILTLFFPVIMNFTAARVLGFVKTYGANLLAERFVPFLLLMVGFFPHTVSLVIALESFAGESERRSIEPLLSTPLTDAQLYLGKLLASLATPLAASTIGMLVYIIAIYRSMNWTAPLSFFVLVFTLTTVQALVMVSGAVVVSTQSTSVRAANLLASFVIVPMALLIQAESVIMFWGNEVTLWWVVLGELVLSTMLIRTGLAYFSREELLGRELDVIDFREVGGILKQQFIGQARSLPEWFLKEIPAALRRLAIPFVAMLFLMAAGWWVGYSLAQQFSLPPSLTGGSVVDNITPGLLTGLGDMGFFSLEGAVAIWIHNLRLLLLVAVLGAFTFGVAGALILMLPMAVLGFFAQNLSLSGISPLVSMAAFTLPHGLLEFPAIALAGAAVLQIGATLVTPSHGVAIGHAWLRSLADWAKVMLVVVAPLFFAAALLEMYVTPYVMLAILSQ